MASNIEVNSMLEIVIENLGIVKKVSNFQFLPVPAT